MIHELLQEPISGRSVFFFVAGFQVSADQVSQYDQKDDHECSPEPNGCEQKTKNTGYNCSDYRLVEFKHKKLYLITIICQAVGLIL